MTAPARHPSALWRTAEWVLRLVVVAGLAVDAWVHAAMAKDFDAIGATITQGGLFRVEAVVAVLVAVLVLAAGRRRLVQLLAVVIAGSALGAVLLYRYVNVGSIGPLPNMYEPIWYGRKTLSAVAEASSLLAALILMAVAAIRPVAKRRDREPGGPVSSATDTAGTP